MRSVLPSVPVLHLRASPGTVAALVAVYAGAGAATLSVTPGPVARCAVLALLAVMLVRDLTGVGLRSRASSVVALAPDPDLRWTVWRRDSTAGRRLELVEVFSHPLVVVMLLGDAAGRRERVVIPRDAAAAEAFRRLRVELLRGRA